MKLNDMSLNQLYEKLRAERECSPRWWRIMHAVEAAQAAWEKGRACGRREVETQSCYD